MTNKPNHNYILQAYDLVKKYDNRYVVDHVNFSVKPGEILGLLGPNGAGKTTFFYMTIGLIRPDQGKIFFKGEDITHLPIHFRAQKGMGYLAQEPSVFINMTVEENILCVIELQNLSRQERKDKLEQLLEELNLTPLAKKRASSLSGGERRRLEITRALVTNPCFLLLDEPFANIDPKSIHDVKILIKHLAEKNISIFITDHNAREIFSIVDRSYLLNEGKVLLSGTVEELIASKQARHFYLGDDFSM